MPKREFLMLCHKYHENIHLNRWFISDKLDGMRAFWDGGISRGMMSKDVPWANTIKDVKDTIATGLWSRLGKVIYAPDDWLDHLPTLPLDGELYIGPQQFQQVMSICRSYEGTDWSDVKYMVFDSPPLESIFADGFIEVRIGNQKYKKEFKGIMDWIINNKKNKVRIINRTADFENVLSYFNKYSIENDVVKVLPQERLPLKSEDIKGAIEKRFNEALENRLEGVVIRAHYESWRPLRANYMLKYKPYNDSEGIVEGFVWGKGKHEDRMGAMIVNWQGKRFELSGFTDQERVLYPCMTDARIPGTVVHDLTFSDMFARGDVVTFRYRELSDNGIPKEARYLTKRHQ